MVQITDQNDSKLNMKKAILFKVTPFKNVVSHLFNLCTEISYHPKNIIEPLLNPQKTQQEPK